MNIVVSKYREGVAEAVEYEYAAEELQIDLVDFKLLESLKMEGEILKEKDALTFRGLLRSRVRRVCGRTLKEVEEDLNVPFALYYPTKGKYEIETLDDLRETILIEQPMVYYAPESEEVNFADPRDEQFSQSVKRINPFEKLKKIRDRLEEG